MLLYQLPSPQESILTSPNKENIFLIRAARVEKSIFLRRSRSIRMANKTIFSSDSHNRSKMHGNRLWMSSLCVPKGSECITTSPDSTPSGTKVGLPSSTQYPVLIEFLATQEHRIKKARLPSVSIGSADM